MFKRPLFNELKSRLSEPKDKIQTISGPRQVGKSTVVKQMLQDTDILQKLLPKLHGSRKKLEPVLQQLWKFCFAQDKRDSTALNAANASSAVYKESADKIRRMYESATANGFTSFAEA